MIPWRFTVERYADLVKEPEFNDLVARHLAEVYPGDPITLDRDRYTALERGGLLKVITARSEGLSGYASYIVNTTLHRKAHRVAINDAFYLAPERRQGMAAVRLLKAAEHFLRGIGVQTMYHASPAERPIDILFAHAGFTYAQTTWQKKLSPPATGGTEPAG